MFLVVGDQMDRAICVLHEASDVNMGGCEQQEPLVFPRSFCNLYANRVRACDFYGVADLSVGLSQCGDNPAQF